MIGIWFGVTKGNPIQQKWKKKMAIPLKAQNAIGWLRKKGFSLKNVDRVLNNLRISNKIFFIF